MNSNTFCNGNHIRLNSAPNRRDFMYVGLLGGLGLSLPNFLRAEAEAKAAGAAVKAKAQSVIHIYLPGGLAHQESFDPKHLATSDYRGPFNAIDTKIPGVKFSEKFTNMAQIADKITVIRSMTHGEAAHERGTHNMFTGYRPSPALKFPSLGSVVSHELGVRKNLPPYVCVPNVPNEFASSGYLSSAFGPFSLGGDPANGGFSVRDLSLPAGITPERFNQRKGLLETVDAHFKYMEKGDAVTSVDTFYQRAYSLISSAEAREAFNLKAEADKLKDEYGRNEAGQRFLLSRRLVEAGVRFVSVTFGSWDHHNNVKSGMEQGGPKLDQALARLIKDLEERGLLDSTLVMVTSEFGRTPKINATGGRDHWPRVFSTVLAGGGTQKGLIYGSSDSLGGEPDTDACTPEDLAATMYTLMGIDPGKRLMSPGDRPIDIVRGGEAVAKLMD